MKRPFLFLLVPFVLGAVLTALLFIQVKGRIGSASSPTTSATTAEAMDTTVHLGWLFSGAYGGEALAAERYGAGLGIRIKLQPGGPGLDPLRLVGDGDFGVASADEVIRVVEKGAPFVIVGVLNDDAPAAFAALDSTGIRTPRDMIGKRVGILPFGSTGLIFRALLKAQNIPEDKVVEIPVSSDMRGFVAEPTHDVHPVYIYDEPVSMDAQGIKYNLIIPRDHGVAFKGPVYFTTRNTVRDNPELVRRFVRACVLGWRDAHASPEQAIESLARIAPEIDARRELTVLKRAMPYYVDGKRRPLSSDVQSWQKMVADLVAFKIISQQIDPKSFMDLTFVDQAYRN